MMVDVSILVITYNQKDFVRETIESCLNQTFDSNRYEIIVSDDGSTDGTQKIIREYADKYANIVPILHEVNTGIANNFNRGLSKVRGKYVALLGGDDLMLKNRLKLQYTFLEANNIFSGCHANAEVFEYPSNKTIGLFSEMFASNLNDNIIDIRKMLNPKYQMLPSTFMIRKTAIPIHGFDTRLKILNDYLFDVEVIIKGGPFGYISNVVSKYRRHENNVGNNKSYKKIILREYTLC
jgi:glycosyltransferase involved in cell wall biosynthesis